MAAALQVVPAGARHIGGNVYQLPRRHSGGGKGHAKKKGHGKKYRHSFFAKQWVWYAIALALADALGTLLIAEVPGWLSVPALFLYAYGVWKKKPGAMNAAYALQAAHMLTYWGITGGFKEAAQKVGLFKSASAEGGGGGGGGGLVKFDSDTIGNAIKNASGIAQAAGEVAAFV